MNYQRQLSENFYNYQDVTPSKYINDETAFNQWIKGFE